MKKYEDFTEGLQKEVRVPEQVWSQYMDTLENIETLAAERKGEDRMRRKRTCAGRTWTKAAAVAGVLLAGTLVFGMVDPVAASELPLIGRIFERIAEDATYSGDYTEKTVLQEEKKNAVPQGGTETMPEAVCTASDQGLTITVSEVYSDGYSVYLAVEAESEEGGLLNISPHYTRRFEEKTSQMLQAAGTWKIGEGEADVLNNGQFEGKAVDDHTFIGMMKLDQEAYSSEGGVLTLELSEICYEDGQVSDGEQMEPEHRIQGTWKLTVPFTADTEHSREIAVNKTGPDGLCIRKVFVSPYQVMVFTDTPYTTLSPDTYTEEDFEKQWGEKNKEITAKGDPAVTYEEMLSRKYYDYYELAVYNQDGEALEMQYGDEEKTVFAVQGHELSKLHIYAADDSDEFGLIKAKSEQEALELSVLDAEVEL